ncbi:MAG: glycosyltransferase 87 family protein [bacterium]|nr:glycosyltransferase 87 family protein [bacterium]
MSKLYLVLIFLFFVIFSGLMNLTLGAGMDWDYMSYHYYNAYALLNNRIGYDMMPAGIQSYLNPLLDIISYLVVNSLRQYPKLVIFIQGIPYGILAFTIYLLNRTIFINCADKKIANYILIFVSTALCISEATLISEIGMSFNDIFPSTLCVVALILLINSIREYKSKYVMWAGFLIGLACGLKFTFGCVAISILISYMFFVPRKDINEVFKRAGLFLLFMFIAFVLAEGWWAYILWQHFKNPVFPFYNGIFKSDLYAPIDYHDAKFLNLPFFNRLFLPLYWFKDCMVIETTFFDMRHIFAYFAIILTPFFMLLNLIFLFFKSGKVKLDSEKKIYLFLVFYVIFGYLIWVNYFCILRYLLPILILNGTMIVLAFVQFPKLLKRVEIYLILILLLVTAKTDYKCVKWGRSKELISSPKLNLPDNSIVYLGGAPMSYFIPGNGNARFVFLIGDSSSGQYNFVQSKKYFKLADKYEKQASKKYLIRHRIMPPDTIRANATYINRKYFVDAQDCKQIETMHFYVDTYYWIPDFKICEID